MNTTEAKKDIVIKVEERPNHAYFVHFDRESGELLGVREYKEIYAPSMGEMSKRTSLVIELARARLGAPYRGSLRAVETKGDNS